jgi:biotin transport system substrate-specific component
MHYHPYSDFFRPILKKDALVYDIVLILGATIFITLCAQITIPLPFTPIPITGQTFAVLLTGVLLGSRRGTLAVIIYLMEGLSGIPVFAKAGFGIMHLLGPSGGYLMGFVPAAFICGVLAEHGWDRHLASAFVTMTIGTVVIFCFGLLWLTQFLILESVLIQGLYPFIPGAIIKISLATILLPGAWKILGKNNKR